MEIFFVQRVTPSLIRSKSSEKEETDDHSSIFSYGVVKVQVKMMMI